MTEQSSVTKASGLDRSSRLPAIAVPLFAATLFVSAFLLFSVQPFFTKMVLPRLGGSPAVWSVAMVFFQAILLLGYGYAHLLTTKFPMRISAIIHATVLAAAFIALPITIPAGWETPPETGQSIWLLGLFTVSVGLPFFAVSANGPLLQAWFARTGHRHAEDPYFLYGASNIGSFASLVLYIVVFEPNLSVSGQSLAWTFGFATLTAAIIACAIYVLATSSTANIAVPGTAQARPVDVSLRSKGEWLLLAAIPSALLVAVTAHISVDIAAAPFLWVAPLALFLFTFVLAFARRRTYSMSALATATTILGAGVFASTVLGGWLSVWAMLALHLAFFFSAALLSHSLLVDRRPGAGGLTGFYFWMSLGGVIGGAFTALLSPALFNWVAEYPLLILASMSIWIFFGNSSFGNSANASGESRPQNPRMALLLAALLVTITNIPPVAHAVLPGEPGFYTIAIAGFALTACYCALRLPLLVPFFAIFLTGLSFAMHGVSGDLYADRSFFGVITAHHADNGRFVVMAHGTTEHGAMRVEPKTPPEPIAYYHRSGTIAATLFASQAKRAGKPSNVGIVGLGAGAMLCHRKPGESWTVFEIDPAVIAVASDASIFRYVSECGADTPMVLGDARLTLADEPQGKFDYLLIDAFSSDSIPVHLLTVEALELYRSRLAPGGILAIHISNRYMELESVVAAMASETGMTGRAAMFLPPQHLRSGEHVNPAHVVVLARSDRDLGGMTTDQRWRPLADHGTTPWTDGYSNILGAILRMQRGV
ncbi:MAG: fused MFS/spermidine synthase [Nitratireductor sp.]